MVKYRPTIGLEIHVELNTRTKMFCDSLNDPDEIHPNVNICPVCLGHPGTLPVPNREAIEKLLKIGLALNCSINEYTFFERKNYFYPDLPKGYQISQYQKPFCENGFLDIGSPPAHKDTDGSKRIRITRIHLEEDAGRLQHSPDGKYTLVDFNRAGVPLMELVTEPDFENGDEVRTFAEELQLILRYLGSSDANMEKGQMRVEVNISLSEMLTSTNSQLPTPNSQLGTKVEIKNLNSIRAAREAVEYEIKRQSGLLGRGEKIIQETRGWDENKRQTFSQRIKEESHDYRYFPEPDIPPVRIQKLNIKNQNDKSRFKDEVSLGINPKEIAVSLPELPQQRRVRFKKEYGLPEQEVEIFTRNKELGDYFEKVVSEMRSWERIVHLAHPSAEHEPRLIKLIANYLITEIPKIQRQELGSSDLRLVDWSAFKITPENFAEFVVRVHNGEVSSSGAQALLKAMYETGAEPEQLIRERNIAQVSDVVQLVDAVRAVIAANPKATADYRQGKADSIKFLIGQVMAYTKGKANPQVVRQLLEQQLS